MRLRRLAEAAPTAAPAEVAGAGQERRDWSHELLGTWSATRWEYRSRNEPSRAVDVVCDLRGVVTLSLSAGAYILTYDVAGVGSGSQGGACELVDGGLRLDRDETDGPEVVRFRVTDQTLALSAESSAWDFDGDGAAEPAGFVAVLVRL